MYRATVYFHGPATAWSEKIAPGEVIAQVQSRWLWLARARAVSTVASLNAGRCGYAITHGDEVIEERRAPKPALG